MCFGLASGLFAFHFLQVYYYYPFSALSDPAKLYNDLRWNLTRPQGFEAVMRVRCSQVIFVVVLICLWPLLLPGIWWWLLHSYNFHYSSTLILFSSFIGYPGFRIPRKLLQTHSNWCWPSWGVYILCKIICVNILHTYGNLPWILSLDSGLCWFRLTLNYWLINYD